MSARLAQWVANCLVKCDHSTPTEFMDLALNNLAALKNGVFDVFLCHNDDEKEDVKKVGRILVRNGILPWLDEWNLRPGLPWQDALETEISRIRSAAVFVGENGIGPWQRQEVKAFLQEFVTRTCPVIPVLLKNALSKPELPLFLRAMTWVDFRKAEPDPIGQLIWGITGKKIAPMMDGEPKYPRYRLDSLADLRNLAHSTGLVEHISDATTVSLLHYPTAVRVITQKKTSSNQGQISLVGGEEAEIQFVDDVRAFCFFYQQGMFHISLEVTMSDGNKVNAEGGEFFPDTNFFGFHSPVPIRSLRISSNPKGGSLILWSFYFYSTSSHQRRFSAQ